MRPKTQSFGLESSQPLTYPDASPSTNSSDWLVCRSYSHRVGSWGIYEQVDYSKPTTILEPYLYLHPYREMIGT